jgi:predicted alpha/beta hydrolase
MELVPFAAPDGATCSPRYFAAGPPRAALLVLPAMGVPARAYDALAAALATRGVATLVTELRGGETSSVRPRRGVDFGYRELLSELPGLAGALRARVPGLPVNVLGHSLGGHLGVLGVRHWHQPGARLVLVASGTVHHRAWEGRAGLALLAQTSFAAAVASLLGYFPGHRLGFGGRQGRRLIVDWARAARTGVFRTPDEALEAGLAEVGLEVLALNVAGDAWAPRRATEGLLGKLPAATLRWGTLPAPPSPSHLKPHFRWLRDPAGCADQVAAFLG